MLAIYVRYSQEDEESKSNSINNQLREGKAWAKQTSMPFKVYNEGEGVSGGASLDKRPQLRALLEDIESEIITDVWFRDHKRLARNNEVSGRFRALVKFFNIKIHFGSGQTQDLNKPEDSLQYGILSELAEYQRELQSLQTKRALLDNIVEGKSHGVLPYGYSTDKDRTLIVDETEAEVVKRAIRMSLDGIGTTKIAKVFNDEGVPTRKGGKWASKQVQSLIKNTIYKGQRFWQGSYYPAPSIIDSDLWQQVNDNLKNNANNSGRKVDHKYLLKGLVKCGSCGSNYYGRSRVSKKDHYYMCSSKRRGDENCGNRSINIDFLEGLIWGYFISQDVFLEKLGDYFEKLNKTNQIEEIQEKKVRLNADLKTVLQRKNNLLNAIEEAVISYSDAKGRMQSIRNEEETIKIKLKHLDEQVAKLDVLDKEQDKIKNETRRAKELAWSDRREFLKKYIQRIEIRSDNDKERTNIEVFPTLEGMDSTIFIAPYSRKFAIQLKRKSLDSSLGGITFDSLPAEVVDASGYAPEGFDSGGYKDFDPENEIMIWAQTFMNS